MDRRELSTSRESPRYRRLAPIASGGMGSVDLCLRTEGGFQRLVALKRLLPALRVDESVRSMFLDEARIAGLLRHPNVVSVIDVGEDEDGPFLVMDYVEGMSLHGMRARMREERMPVGVVARIVADCARGLHAAHELRGHDGTWLGLVHRDVSPHNVLVGFDGQVKLTDFGISKAVGRQTRTSTGLLKGKLGYMAPEQLRFEDADRRSDVFALGVVLHELLTGVRLFEGEPRIVAQKVLNGQIPAVRELRPDVPEAFAQLAARMLAMRPAGRPATAEDVAIRIEEILRADPIACDVAAFAASRFDADRQRTSAEIAALVAAVEDGSEAPEPATPPAPELPATEGHQKTSAATPAAIAARPSSRRRALTWALVACFLLTPAAMWAIDAAWSRERAPETPTATGMAPPVVADPIDEPRDTPQPVEASVQGPESEPTNDETAPLEDAPAPRRARPRARARSDDPMGRWDWE